MCIRDILKYATEVRAVFAVQFQVINKNTWDSFGADIQPAFAAAAQDAADQANGLDEGSEQSFAQKLRDAGMQIHMPSAQEMAQWQKIGEDIWEGAGKSVDRNVVKAMIALR